MEKRIEFLPKVSPPKKERVTAAIAKTVGIPLIILIQIVFLAFLGFYLKLNQDLTNLSASISRKEKVLAQAKEVEDLLRSTQSKLQMIATVKEGFCYSCALQVLKEVTPPKIVLTTISFTGERLSFTAETAHGPSFALFVANLFEEESIKEAAITSGSLGHEGRFTLAMELLFDKEKVVK